MKFKYIFTGLIVTVLSVFNTFAQITIADWTFDVSQPTTLGPISPEAGSGEASASGISPTNFGGNPGSGKAYAGTQWSVGSYWQFQVNTIGLSGIAISFDQEGSGTGPAQFALQYSTDGVNFTQFGDTYSLGTTANKWLNTFIDLSSIAELDNISTVYFRVIVASSTDINGGAIGSQGTSRIDNVLVTASGTVVTMGAPTIFTNPQSTNVIAGRSVALTVTASGSDPLSYQWYYPDLSTPLADNVTVSGSTSAALTLNNVTTNQTGDYQVIVSNPSGSITSSIAHLVVTMPITTNIAYLRTLEDPVNWAPTDTTNLYTVQGTVTTVVNVTSAGNAEFYIQDGTAGISVFVSGGTSVPDAGSLVQVTGPLGQYNGLLELNLNANNPDHSVTVIGSNPLPTPAPFMFSSVTDIPYMETTEGSLVVVSNVFLGSTNSYFAPGTVTLTNLSGQTFTLFLNANQGDILNSPIPQFATSITGVLGQYKASVPYTSGYELDITQYGDLVVGTPLPPVVLPIPLNIQTSGNNITLTWSDASFSLQSSTNVNGPYSSIPAAAGLTSYINAMTNQANFYRLMHP